MATTESEAHVLTDQLADPAVRDLYESAAHHSPRTDAGNAELFALMYGTLVRYDHARSRWLVWDSHRWKPDDDAAVHRMALESVRYRLNTAAASDLDTDARTKLVKWALQSESKSRLDALLGIARTLLPIADDGRGWDETPWLLGVPNGVVDLRTGELRDGRPEDKITMQAGVEYDPGAVCPRWRRFLREVLEADPETDTGLARFFQTVLGYIFSGDPVEHLILFLMGVGGNGKSTALGVLQRVAGDYARVIEASAIKAQRYDRHSTEVAHLELSRFAYCEELGDERLNAGRLKNLSGSRTITARRMHRDDEEYARTWTLVLTSNGLPRSDDSSWAFWRRVVVLAFPHVFKHEDDPTLAADLERELPGILTWIAWGAKRYFEQGLGERPDAVVEATAEYREQVDPLEPVFEAGVLIADPDAWTPTDELHRAYTAWANFASVPLDRRYGQDGFSKVLGGRFTRARCRPQPGAAKVRGFAGVRVGAVPEPPEPLS